MNYLSISALTKYIKAKFERDPYLEQVYIKGELSNVKHHSSGHYYFALKDGAALMNGMMFKRDASKLTFSPKDGDQVLISGRVSVYESRGSYQLYVHEMALDGIGQLYERFEALKKELGDKGLFDKSHKKPLPRYPAKIAILTASTGAAVRDMESTLKRRYPLAEVIYISTLVQGVGAADDIVNNIKQADTMDVDVIIVGRGGGSIEDLWAFNEQKVVEAIYAATTPIISAVGHETDTTLSDYAADFRAETPTAAAVAATPDQIELMNQLKSTDVYLRQQLTQHIRFENERLNRLMNHPVFRQPRVLIDTRMQRKDELEQRMKYALKDQLNSSVRKFDRVTGQLSKERINHRIHMDMKRTDQLSVQLQTIITRQRTEQLNKLELQSKLLNTLNPTGILDRGYSIVRNSGGIINSIQSVELGDHIDIQLADGSIHPEIMDKKEDHHG